MNDMTIHDIIEKREELEDNIATMLNEFSRVTGIAVSNIKFDWYQCVSETTPRYTVNIEALI